MDLYTKLAENRAQLRLAQAQLTKTEAQVNFETMISLKRTTDPDTNKSAWPTNEQERKLMLAHHLERNREYQRACENVREWQEHVDRVQAEVTQHEQAREDQKLAVYDALATALGRRRLADALADTLAS